MQCCYVMLRDSPGVTHLSMGQSMDSEPEVPRCKLWLMERDSTFTLINGNLILSEDHGS